MTIYYSPSRKGFFDSEIHTELPADRLFVTDEVYRALLTGQSMGQRIMPGADGVPELQAQPPPPPGPRYVPVPLMRERLEAAGKWNALAAILAADPPTMLKVLTLARGVDATDPEAIALITAAGANPAVILAP